jgi:hypothetical protein
MDNVITIFIQEKQIGIPINRNSVYFARNKELHLEDKAFLQFRHKIGQRATGGVQVKALASFGYSQILDATLDILQQLFRHTAFTLELLLQVALRERIEGCPRSHSKSLWRAGFIAKILQIKDLRIALENSKRRW